MGISSRCKPDSGLHARQRILRLRVLSRLRLVRDRRKVLVDAVHHVDRAWVRIDAPPLDVREDTPTYRLGARRTPGRTTAGPGVAAAGAHAVKRAGHAVRGKLQGAHDRLRDGAAEWLHGYGTRRRGQPNAVDDGDGRQGRLWEGGSFR